MSKLAVVVPTFNRAASLERTLRSLRGHRGNTHASHRGNTDSSHRGNTEETQAGNAEETRVALIVVDNNSADATADVVAAFGPEVRYVREARQGLSFARNTGIDAARGLGADYIAFIDDDVEAAPDWAESLLRALEEHPDADCVGGRVLPLNASDFPRWLTPEHWGPLALQDHGDRALVFDAKVPRGLIGANFAFRRDAFDRLGEFSPRVQRVKDGVGSTEDHEMLQRLYDAGGRAAYVPDVVVRTRVPPERMTHEYHRRWHLGHGRFTARMQLAGTEQTTRGRFLGIPAHLFRTAMSDAMRWIRLSAVRDGTRAFEAETRLWFFSGFFQERCGCAPRR